MTPEQYANAVFQRLQQDWDTRPMYYLDDTNEVYHFNWWVQLPEGATRVGCEITKDLFDDLDFTEDGWIDATVEHCRVELRRPAGEIKHRTFGIDSEGRYFDIDRVNPWLYPKG
jgi:hypothetical protein